MTFQRYERYKDSGLEWLGEVPEHWQVNRLKFSARLIMDRATSRTNPIALEHIEPWTGRLVPSDTTFEGEGIAFRSGDVLFGKLRPYLAKAYLAHGDGEAVGDFHVMRPTAGVSGEFFLHQILNRDLIEIIDGSTFGAKMPRVGWDFMSNIPLLTPPLNEQAKIADFVDIETAKIDALIEEQRRLIELLKEKRQAVISHAVTKGLDPDAPMKDSGTAWLGQVPQHWTIAAVRHRYSVDLGKMLDEKKDSGSFPAHDLRNVDVQWNCLNLLGLPSMNFEANERERYAVRRNDLLVCEGGDLGRAAYISEDLAEIFYQKALLRLRTLVPSIDHPKFMLFQLWNANLQERFLAAENKTTIGHLPAEKLRAYLFPFPPVKEQRAIVDYLDHFMEDLKSLTNTAKEAICLLQERRSALISAAVTGKIDVRHSTPKEAA